jgi:hypothetical protein
VVPPLPEPPTSHGPVPEVRSVSLSNGVSTNSSGSWVVLSSVLYSIVVVVQVNMGLVVVQVSVVWASADELAPTTTIVATTLANVKSNAMRLNTTSPFPFPLRPYTGDSRDISSVS